MATHEVTSSQVATTAQELDHQLRIGAPPIRLLPLAQELLAETACLVTELSDAATAA